MSISISNISSAVRVIDAASGIFLNKGQILNGKILEVYPNNLAAININGRKFTAEIPFRMEPGNSVILEVTAISPKITLSIINSDTSSKIPTFRGRVALISSDLFSLMDGFSSLFTASNSSEVTPSPAKQLFFNLLRILYQGKGSDSLKEIIMLINEGKGSGYIANKDLKAELLKFTGRRSDKLSEASKKIIDRMDNFLKDMEMFNRSQPKGFYVIPFLFEGEFGFATLYGDSSGKEESLKRKQLTYIFNIEMTAIGQVETLINISDHGAVIVIKVDNEESHSFIKKNISLLRKSIEKTGVKVFGADVVLVHPSNNSLPLKNEITGDLDMFA